MLNQQSSSYSFFALLHFPNFFTDVYTNTHTFGYFHVTSFSDPNSFVYFHANAKHHCHIEWLVHCHPSIVCVNNLDFFSDVVADADTVLIRDHLHHIFFVTNLKGHNDCDSYGKTSFLVFVLQNIFIVFCLSL